MPKDVILTPEGLANLKSELEHLSTTRRREVAARIKEAREFGDISENAEYDDAKNEQAMLEARMGFPAEVNDLQFLTGPVVGNILGGSGQQVIGGTSSLDLEAFGAGGAPASAAWPKLTGDWTGATPLLGSFGTLDSARGARKDVVSITRSGTLSVYSTPASACSASSSPRYHHDLANAGDYTRDAVPPGRPWAGRLRGRTLAFRAPGGDLLCGRAQRYEVVTSRHAITAANFGRARLLHTPLAPGPAGARQHLKLPAGTLHYVAIRAVDAAGNLGLPLVLSTFR